MVVEPTRLKNMRKSNWIMQPQVQGMIIKNNVWNHHLEYAMPYMDPSTYRDV